MDMISRSGRPSGMDVQLGQSVGAKSGVMAFKNDWLAVHSDLARIMHVSCNKAFPFKVLFESIAKLALECICTNFWF